jgi:hypothetical protein
MHKLFCLAYIAALPCLSACGTLLSAPTPPWPWQKSSACQAECRPQEALVAYTKASEFCRGVQNFYEAGGQRANSTKLAVGVTGTLAGAVFAPIASGRAVTAWSGLSGAANGIQSSFDETFSTSLAVNRRAFVVAAVVEGDRRYTAAPSQDEKVIAAISMATACANAAALADREALQSITRTPVTQGSIKTETAINTAIKYSALRNGSRVA